MTTTLDALSEATEQLSLVEGVLLEARDMHERIRQGLQALENAKAELAAARKNVEGAK